MTLIHKLNGAVKKAKQKPLSWRGFSDDIIVKTRVAHFYRSIYCDKNCESNSAPTAPTVTI